MNFSAPLGSALSLMLDVFAPAAADADFAAVFVFLGAEVAVVSFLSDEPQPATSTPLHVVLSPLVQ